MTVGKSILQASDQGRFPMGQNFRFVISKTFRAKRLRNGAQSQQTAISNL